MKHLKNTALLCAVLILTGCAGRHKEFIALPETVQTQLESTDVYLVDCPDKMGFDIKNSNVASYTGGVNFRVMKLLFAKAIFSPTTSRAF